MRAKLHKECLRFQKAVDLLHRTDTRLMIMRSGDGDEFYVVPGGRVAADDAKKILLRPDMIPFDDGLFPNNPQSWKMVR